MAIKWTYELVKELFESKGYYLVDTEYINVHTKLTFYDCDGYYYKQIFKDFLKHPSYKVGKSNPYSIHNIKLWCKLNNSSFELLDGQEYIDAFYKLKWQCLKENCGEIFEANWGSISMGNGCGFCRGLQVGFSNCLATKNPKLASEWHFILNGDLTPYNVSYGSGKDIWWQCSKNEKHVWNAKVTDRNNLNSGCPYCSHNLPSEDYNLLFCSPKLCEEWDYSKNKKLPSEYTPNSGESVFWVCKDCGYKWNAIIHSRNSGTFTGCPKCSISKGEKRLDIILSNYNIPHDSQYKFSDLKGLGRKPLKFDVPIFYDKAKTQLRMLIEYDGEQHFRWIKGLMTKKQFETLQIHDELKNQYCKNNNIKLLRIPYWEFNNIETILKNELKIKEEL